MRQCLEKMTLKFACILSRASGKMQGNFYLFLGGSPPCLPHILQADSLCGFTVLTLGKAAPNNENQNKKT